MFNKWDFFYICIEEFDYYDVFYQYKYWILNME